MFPSVTNNYFLSVYCCQLKMFLCVKSGCAYLLFYPTKIYCWRPLSSYWLQQIKFKLALLQLFWCFGDKNLHALASVLHTKMEKRWHKKKQHVRELWSRPPEKRNDDNTQQASNCSFLKPQQDIIVTPGWRGSLCCREHTVLLPQLSDISNGGN